MQPVALVVSDIHLSDKAPVCREEKGDDWYEYQRKCLLELQQLKTRLGVPVLYAGDVFDTWKSPPRLINFAAEHLPIGYSIPGQHELPHHNYQDITKSAYWTLVRCGILKDLIWGNPVHLEVRGKGLLIYGFPWGAKIQGCGLGATPLMDGTLNVALVHRYIWSVGHEYPGAPQDKHVDETAKLLKGFDVAFFGDNHKGFKYRSDPLIVNCGGFMRRKSDEKDYVPRAWILYSDGSVKSHKLDRSEDKFCERSAEMIVANGMHDFAEFIEDLDSLGEVGLDFVESVKRLLEDRKIRKEVRKIVLKFLED